MAKASVSKPTFWPSGEEVPTQRKEGTITRGAERATRSEKEHKPSRQGPTKVLRTEPRALTLFERKNSAAQQTKSTHRRLPPQEHRNLPVELMYSVMGFSASSYCKYKNSAMISSVTAATRGMPR